MHSSSQLSAFLPAVRQGRAEARTRDVRYLNKLSSAFARIVTGPVTMNTTWFAPPRSDATAPAHAGGTCVDRLRLHNPTPLVLKRRFTSLSNQRSPPTKHAYGFPHSSLKTHHHRTINALDYKFKLTTAFQKALDDQEAAAALYTTPATNPLPHTRRSAADTAVSGRFCRGRCARPPPPLTS